MSAEIVNLRRVRKDRAREANAAEAQDNRLRFGRTRAEKALIEARANLSERRIEGHRIEAPPGDERER